MTPTNGEKISPRLTTDAGKSPPSAAGSDTYVDPSTRQNDFAGYRIYRSTYFTIGPWTLVADIPKADAEIVNGMVQYVDDDLPNGVGNYYCVTTYDTDGHESGKVNNNRFLGISKGRQTSSSRKKKCMGAESFRQTAGLLGRARAPHRIYRDSGALRHQNLYADRRSGAGIFTTICSGSAA